MLNAEKAPGGGELWSGPRGELRIWSPASTVMVVRLRGHGMAEFAPLIALKCDGLSDGGADCDVYFDSECLESYDPPLRTVLVARFRREGARPRRIHILSTSRIVHMGVTVARIVLGEMIKTYRTREAFTEAIEAHLRELGVHGFVKKAGLAESLRWQRADLTG